MGTAPETMAMILLERTGQTTVPIDVSSCCGAAGAMLARNHFDGSQASFALLHDRPVIGVNSRISVRRERFATAHAIGHLILHLHPDRRLIACVSVLDLEPERQGESAPTSAQEAEANQFAGSLLMPERLLHLAVRDEVAASHPSRDAMIKSLARRFEVSPEAMGWRLISLGFVIG